MPRSNDQKKIIETRALVAARKAGVPIPLGETPGEEPDFRFNEGILGIEISELLKPASSNFGIVPAEAESYHQEIRDGQAGHRKASHTGGSRGCVASGWKRC